MTTSSIFTSASRLERRSSYAMRPSCSWAMRCPRNHIRDQIMKRIAFPLVFGLAVASIAGVASAQTLKAVKDRGLLVCGVSEGLYGFSATDDKSNWGGFDVDFCRAMAAAI